MVGHYPVINAAMMDGDQVRVVTKGKHGTVREREREKGKR